MEVESKNLMGRKRKGDGKSMETEKLKGVVKIKKRVRKMMD